MTHTPRPTRGIKLSRWGLGENPIGLHVLMPNSDLREVYDAYRRESPACIMLKVRSFNREITDEIAAGAARILDRSWRQS